MLAPVHAEMLLYTEVVRELDFFLICLSLLVHLAREVAGPLFVTKESKKVSHFIIGIRYTPVTEVWLLVLGRGLVLYHG